MSENEPVVKVTLPVIYEKLLEVDKKVDPIPSIVADHESRIRALERQVWIWLGASGVVGGGIVALIQKAVGS